MPKVKVQTQTKLAVGDTIIHTGPGQFGITFVKPGDKGIITKLSGVHPDRGQLFVFDFIEREQIPPQFGLNDWYGCARYWTKVESQNS